MHGMNKNTLNKENIQKYEYICCNKKKNSV